MNKLIYPTLTALVLTGCVNGKMPNLSGSHPANPSAASATYPKSAPFLMTDTNLAAMMTVSTNGLEQGDEHGHQTKPEPKPAPQHDHD